MHRVYILRVLMPGVIVLVLGDSSGRRVTGNIAILRLADPEKVALHPGLVRRMHRQVRDTCPSAPTMVASSAPFQARHGIGTAHFRGSVAPIAESSPGWRRDAAANTCQTGRKPGIESHRARTAPPEIRCVSLADFANARGVAR